MDAPKINEQKLSKKRFLKSEERATLHTGSPRRWFCAVVRDHRVCVNSTVQEIFNPRLMNFLNFINTRMRRQNQEIAIIQRFSAGTERSCPNSRFGGTDCGCPAKYFTVSTDLLCCQVQRACGAFTSAPVKSLFAATSMFSPVVVHTLFDFSEIETLVIVFAPRDQMNLDGQRYKLQLD